MKSDLRTYFHHPETQFRSGWGQASRIKSNVYHIDTKSDGGLHGNNTKGVELPELPVIPAGNGRSYGDSALQTEIVSGLGLNQIYEFDTVAGTITCGAGVLLQDILSLIVPNGWFLSVTPGTSRVSVGGAIAADVHGKNHHMAGCISNFVDEITLLTYRQEQQSLTELVCSPRQYVEWFRATCGGMGLTGFITRVRIHLIRIPSSYVRQVSITYTKLSHTLEAFNEFQSSPYSVAWLDVMSEAPFEGRAVFTYGDFCEPDGRLTPSHQSYPDSKVSPVFQREMPTNVYGLFHKLYPIKKGIKLPDFWPENLLNSQTVTWFNRLYLALKSDASEQTVPFTSFFYPLDAIQNWNMLYGASGFYQYQMLIPDHHALEAIQETLRLIRKSGVACPLAVLKKHGAQNDNLLSFPRDGYSLALDLKATSQTNSLMRNLDDVLIRFNGRINLCKDARIPREIFELGYPEVDTFRKFRRKHGLAERFSSLQSERLGL